MRLFSARLFLPVLALVVACSTRTRSAHRCTTSPYCKCRIDAPLPGGTADRCAPEQSSCCYAYSTKDRESYCVCYAAADLRGVTCDELYDSAVQPTCGVSRFDCRRTAGCGP